MLAKPHLFWLLACPLIASCGFLQETQTIEIGQISTEGLSAYQAEQILNYVLEHEKVKPDLPRAFLEPNNSEGDKGSPTIIYYTFTLYHSDPNAAALSNLGLFAVSKNTGDVFEIHSCKRFQFPALQDIQRRVMDRTGKTVDGESPQQVAVDCLEGVTLQGSFPPE